MSVARGCGCAPDETIRWLVGTLLGVAGAAVLVSRAWLHRRDTRCATPPSDAPGPGSDPRSRAERSAPVVAGLIICALALLVAFVPMSSGPALLVLALGATVGTAGFGFGAKRTRPDSEPAPR